MHPFLECWRAKPLRTAGCLALAVSLSVGAAWLWAHEGHQALPNRGASVDLDKGLVLLSPESRAALGVATAEARLVDFAETWTAPAVVETTWQGRAYASTRLAGKIAAIHVQPGQEIAAGQALADVQSLELENLRLELATAESEARLSAANLKAIEDSARELASSEQAVLQERIHHLERLNALELARQKRLTLGVKPDGDDKAGLLPIFSPIAGVVVHADVRPGQVVEPTQHLFEIVDLTTIRVKAEVLESDLGRMAPALPFNLRLAAAPNSALHGFVRGAGLTLDAKTRFGEVWGDLTNPTQTGPRLLPGMYGRVEFRRETHGKAIAVPTAAVVPDGAETVVFLAEGPGQYVRKPVVVLRWPPDRVLLARGVLEPGDPIVTTGSHELGALFDRHELRLSAEAARSAGLVVEPATRHSVADIVSVEAVVDLPPDKRALASARLPGVLRAIHKDRDQVVRAGDVIGEIASLEAQSLQLDLLRSHLHLRVLRQTLDRLRPLAQSGSPAVSSRQVREAETALDAEDKRADSLRRRLVQAGLTQEQLRDVVEERQFIDTIPVRAPIDGVLVRSLAPLGQAVKAEDPLFEVQDLSSVWVQGQVLERDLVRVRPGQKVRISLTADASFAADGVVRRMGQVLDAEDRTLPIWVELSGKVDRPLPVGSLARLALVITETPPTLAVPRGAVSREANQAYLFLRQANGSYERRGVRTGRTDDRFIEIKSGLQEGEAVAVRGVAALQAAYATLR